MVRLGATGLDPALSKYSDIPLSRCTARRDSAPGPEPEKYHVSDCQGEEQSRGCRGVSLRSAGRLQSCAVEKRSGEGLHEDVTAESWIPSYMAYGLLDGSDDRHLYRHESTSYWSCPHYEIQAPEKGKKGGIWMAPLLRVVRSRYHFRTSDLETLFIEEQHGSFGGPSLTSDAYYVMDSDDFRGYAWKIPETSMLLQQRKEIGADH